MSDCKKPTSPPQQRKIIHIDMDCFYAAVEMRDFPQLKNHPIAVGGQPQQRGVVATCNYPARAFGIHSAMPMAQALKKCPQLIVRPVRMPVYRHISQQIRTIFKQHSNIIQPLSLDEAFIDVSHATHLHGSATLIASQIRRQIKQQHGLTASAGIAPNKFLAKIASDWNKPNGQFVITPPQVKAFVEQLPIDKIFGVGKVTAAKMHRLGIYHCSQLQQLSIQQMHQHFGKFGQQLYQLCRGIDDRPLQTQSNRKSLSVEDTFSQDLKQLQQCLQQTDSLFKTLQARHQAAQQKQPKAIKTLFVKVRFNNFQTTTAQTSQPQLKRSHYRQLIHKAWHRQQRPVRLIGLGIRYAQPTEQQLNLNF